MKNQVANLTVHVRISSANLFHVYTCITAKSEFVYNTNAEAKHILIFQTTFCCNICFSLNNLYIQKPTSSNLFMAHLQFLKTP